MQIDTLNQTIESISRESGVEKVILYNMSGSAICENTKQNTAIFNFEEIQEKAKAIIELTQKNKVKSEDMLISMEPYNVLINFLKNSTLILFCNDTADFPTLNASTKIASKKIYKSLEHQSKSPQTKQQNYQSLTIKAKTNSFKKSEHPIIVILKKMVCESEGPIGSIIFKRSLRLTGIDPTYVDAQAAETLVDDLAHSLSRSKSENFSHNAQKVILDYFR